MNGVNKKPIPNPQPALDLSKNSDSETEMAKPGIKLKLTTYDGLHDGRDFMDKIEMVKTACDWDDKEAAIQMQLHLTGPASTWIRTMVKDTVKAKWDTLLSAFKERWVNQDPLLLTEQKLLARKLQPGESLEEYYAAILDFAQKLGRTPDEMAAYFVGGLPDVVKENVLSGDTHDLGNYMRRAKMFIARNPAYKSVSFDSVHMVSAADNQRNMAAEISKEVVGSIADMMSELKISSRPNKGEDDKRSRESSPYRSRERKRYRERERFRDRYSSSRSNSRSSDRREKRNRSWSRNSRPSYRRYASRDRVHYTPERRYGYRQQRNRYPLRRRAPTNGPCFRCGRFGHWQNRCNFQQQAPMPQNQYQNNNNNWQHNPHQQAPMPQSQYNNMSN